jgi:Ca-activated chloride channel homolog
MKTKWILILIALAVAFSVYRKVTAPDPSDTVATDVDSVATQDPEPSTESLAPAEVESLTSAWPPVEEGVVAAAAPTANYYIVLDGSGSMMERECTGSDNTRKIEVAIDSVRRFVAAIPADANVGLAVFDRRDLSERVRIGDGNRGEISQALTRVRAGAGTPLKSAVRLGFERLTAQASAQLGYGEYHLVVVTDGRPDREDEDPTSVVSDILSTSPVVLHTVGFCIDENHVLNQPGRTYYTAASNPDELQRGLQAVLAEAPSFDSTKFN